MSIRFMDNNGVESILSGLTPGGEIERGTVATRNGSITIPVTSQGASGNVTIVFGEALPDDDYEVVLSESMSNPYTISVIDKTVNGFKLGYYATAECTTAIDINWKAFILYDVAKAEQNASDITNIKDLIPSSASIANKLATNKQVSDLALNINFRMDDIEDMIPEDASITNKLATAQKIIDETSDFDERIAAIEEIIPEEASDENKLVTLDELAEKQDLLTFDPIPTEASDNPVSSGGLYDAFISMDEGINDVWTTVNKNGVKNLLLYPFANTTTTIDGITFTDNGDGSITCNGTATDIAVFHINGSQFVNGAKYVLSGCPEGGGHAPTGVYTLLTEGEDHCDDGEGVEFVWNENITGIAIAVYTGITVDNVTFWPMLRLAGSGDDNYEPYAMTNRELTESRFVDPGKGINVDVVQNFTDIFDFTITKSGWYALLLQNNDVVSDEVLTIGLTSNDYVVGTHRCGGMAYESAYVTMPLTAGTLIRFKCTDATVQCQARVVRFLGEGA